jgi:hypothetical protein
MEPCLVRRVTRKLGTAKQSCTPLDDLQTSHRKHAGAQRLLLETKAGRGGESFEGVRAGPLPCGLPGFYLFVLAHGHTAQRGFPPQIT